MRNIARRPIYIHSWKKAGSRDPGSHDFFGQNKFSEKLGKILQKVRKNSFEKNLRVRKNRKI